MQHQASILTVKLIVALQVILIFFLVSQCAQAQEKEHVKIICTCKIPAFVIEGGVVYNAQKYEGKQREMLNLACKGKIGFNNADIFETKTATGQACPVSL